MSAIHFDLPVQDVDLLPDLLAEAGRRALKIVDRLGHSVFGGIRFGDQIGEARAGFAWCVASGAADDLDHFGQAGAITDGECVVAPNPVEAFLGHAQRDNDVHPVAVVLLRRVSEGGGDAVALRGVVVDDGSLEFLDGATLDNVVDYLTYVFVPALIVVKAGERILVETPGAGGYGPPAERDPAALEEDRRSGKFGAAWLKERYGGGSG